MKKYLLGIFAIALAVGFSAFTTKSAKAPKSAKFTNHYFFSVVGNLSDGTTLTLNNTDFLEKNTDGTIPSVTGCNQSNHMCVIDITDDTKVESDGNGGFQIVSGGTTSYVIDSRKS